MLRQAIKAALSAAILAAAAALIWTQAIEPVSCSRLELTLIAATQRAVEAGDSPLARDTLERTARAIRHCPSNLNLRMIAAANLRQLGRPNDAIRLYEDALRYGRRPEIYLNIGQARLEAGMSGRAVDDFVRAVEFAPSMIEEVPPGPARDAVYQRMALESTGAALRNGDFSLASLAGPGELRGVGQIGPSAALDWNVFIGGQGFASARTERVPSTRRPGGTMLHVVTNSEASGVSQQWAPAGLGPQCAWTEAWVFVRRGFVQISTGNGGYTVPTGFSSKHGTWEHLAAANYSMPANYTMVTSYGVGGADFDVDLVTVKPIAGPCGPK